MLHYRFFSSNCSVPRLAVSIVVLLLVVASISPKVEAAPPKNVILMIGDGMGPEQVKAAGMYLNGAAGTLSFELFPSQAVQTTHPFTSTVVTDSAAGATAMATGVKVFNRVLSVSRPGDGSELPTMLEILKAQGKSTGLVTTVGVTGATPAAFAAHEIDRRNKAEIGQDYLNQTRPNVIFGGTDIGGFDASIVNADGNYTLVENRAELNALDTNTEPFVAGLFGTGSLPFEYDYDQGTDTGYDTAPHLSEMTSKALDLLDNDTDGFFLMIEGGRIDDSGHLPSSNLKTHRNIFETIEFANAVQKVVDWANINDPGFTETLILVTADHETGNLTVTENNPTAGVLPSVSWGGTSHTGVNVPLAAIGVNSELVTGVLDNTDLLGIALANQSVPEPSTITLLLGALAAAPNRRRFRIT